MSSYAAIIRIQNLLDDDLIHVKQKDEFSNGCLVKSGDIPERIEAGTTGPQIIVQPPKDTPASPVSGSLGYTIGVDGPHGLATEIGFRFACGPNVGPAGAKSAATITSHNPERFSSQITPYSSSDIPLEATYTIYPVNGTGHSRHKRGIIPSTTKVVNDTDTAVYCSMASRGSGRESQVLAAAGLGVAVFGLLPFGLPATAAWAAAGNIISWNAALSGLLLGVLGAVPLLDSVEGPAQRVLFPADTMKHTSTGGIFQSSHDVTLFKLAIDNGSLIFQSSSMTDHTQPELRIDTATFQEIFRLKLSDSGAGTYQLQCCRLLIIPDLRPQDLEPMSSNQTKMPDSYAISLSNHGTQRANNYWPRIRSGKAGESTPTFTLLPNRTSAFVLAASSKTNHSGLSGIYQLFPQLNGAVVVQFKNMEVVVKNDSKPLVAKEYLGVSVSDIPKEVIDSKKNDVFVFEWWGSWRTAEYLKGWSFDQVTSIKQYPGDHISTRSCYFIVPYDRVTINQIVEKSG